MTYSPRSRCRPLAVSLLSAWMLASACGERGAASTTPAERKIGILIVSHGSRSARWREMVTDVEERTRERVLASPHVATVRSAFMEYTEPSIATQLEALDREGHTDIVLVPLLLTVSGHSFDDIPVIAGQREDAVTSQRLAAEGIRRYRPRARVHFAPLLDFAGILRTNVERRVAALRGDASRDGVVLVAYGDHEYDTEWTRLLDELGGHLRETLGIETVTHAWCGHLVAYDRGPTRTAIARALDRSERAIVVPILVAVDERFQFEIIGGAVQEARTQAGEARVVYRPDAILPEPTLDDWVVEISNTTAARALAPEAS